jgi:hypothetical protein
MKDKKPEIQIRDMRDGDWYWINKAILYLYGQRLKVAGIALYNALASFANSETQTCFPTQKTIAALIGSSPRTVIRRIKLLKELDLVRVEKKKGRCLYYLLEPEVTKEAQGGDKKNTADVTGGRTNKNYRTRIINNIDIEDKKILDSNITTFKEFRPKTREELLALDIAEALDDYNGLPLYLFYAKKYPEHLLRRVLGEVKEIPAEKIKKSRGALFNHLIKRYVQKANHNFGN